MDESYILLPWVKEYSFDSIYHRTSLNKTIAFLLYNEGFFKYSYAVYTRGGLGAEHSLFKKQVIYSTSLNRMKSKFDKKLIELGYTLLSSDRAEKLKLLI